MTEAADTGIGGISEGDTVSIQFDKRWSDGIGSGEGEVDSVTSTSVTAISSSGEKYFASVESGNVIDRGGRSIQHLGKLISIVNKHPDYTPRNRTVKRPGESDEAAESEDSEESDDSDDSDDSEESEPEKKRTFPYKGKPIRIGDSIGRIRKDTGESYSVQVVLGDIIQRVLVSKDYADRNIIDPELIQPEARPESEAADL